MVVYIFILRWMVRGVGMIEKWEDGKENWRGHVQLLPVPTRCTFPLLDALTTCTKLTAPIHVCARNLRTVLGRK
jgi:hypothetical protein